METTNQEKVYVVVGKDVEEGLGTLKWALRKWSSQPISFVILHVTTGSKDFVHTTFGKSPASSVNGENLDIFRATEDEKVDEILSKYMALCHNVRAEVLRFDKSDEPVHKILVGVISSLRIKRLVIGFTNTKSLSWKARSDVLLCYVHKHKPEFCEVFIICGGRLLFFKGEDEGGYLEDEEGETIGDFRKKSKEKGNCKWWPSRKWLPNASSDIDNLGSLHHQASPSSVGFISDRWEDNEEEIESYVQNLLASTSPELNGEYETVEQAKINYMLKDSINRTEALKVIEEAKKTVEETKNQAKVEVERRRKAERIVSIFSQRAEEIEDKLREELAKEVCVEEELDTVIEQLQNVRGNVTENESKLKTLIDQQGYFITKLQAYSLEKSDIETEIAKAESEKVKILAEVEEIRLRRDTIGRSIAYLKERDVMNGWKYGYREFSEEELSDATDGFSQGCMIETGAQGKVYRGKINNTTVAIHLMTAYCAKPLEEFMVQVDLLCQIRHPHLLTMVGVCIDLRCIVFEYMQLGSLNEALFSSKTQHLHIPWHARFRIAADLCSALGFLHSSQPRRVVHGHLYSSCVLMDHNLNVRITGFCASNSGFPRSDVTSLGMLMLQLLIGREKIDVEEMEMNLKGGSLLDILDEKGGDWPNDLTTEFTRIGLQYAAVDSSDHAEGVTEEMTKELEDLCMRAGSRIVHGGEKRREDGRADVPDGFLCPIFQVQLTAVDASTWRIKRGKQADKQDTKLEVMKEPYAAADGFSYELEAIKEWLKTGHETSPMTNLKLNNKHLTPNHTLHSLINEWHQNL